VKKGQEEKVKRAEFAEMAKGTTARSRFIAVRRMPSAVRPVPNPMVLEFQDLGKE
jgi:hypothetical protein